MNRGFRPSLNPSFSVQADSKSVNEDDELEDEEEEEEEEDEEKDATEEDGTESPKARMITRYAKSLIRDFLHNHRFKKTLEAFDKEAHWENSKENDSKVLQEELHLSNVVLKNNAKNRHYALFAMLEHIVEDRISHPEGTSRKAKNEKKRVQNNGTPYQLVGSGSAVILDNYELSSQRLRHVGEITLPTTLSDLQKGRLINDVSELDFSKELLIGCGASGHVYQVFHKPTGQYLAVKKISIHDENRRKEIVKELNLLYNNANCTKNLVDAEVMLGIRYVIRFYGAFFEEGNTLIALECMAGSLEDVIREVKVIEEGILKAITWQIVSALFYLNKAHHIQHRDIKAANILVSKDGRVKLSDFGVASDEKAATMAQAQTFVGTVIYMSPERLLGNPYAPNADIWSFGLVLLHAATGVHPFKGMDPYKIMTLLNDGTLPTLPSSFSKEFIDFIDKCLIRDPKQRPSAEGMWRHRFISGFTSNRSERVILEWSDPIVARLEMQRVNGTIHKQLHLQPQAANAFKELDGLF